MVTDNASTDKRKRGRSPSYPGIGLEDALGRVRLIWNTERKHAASIDTIQGHWGYASKSGQGAIIIAALKKFGLIEDEGIGEARRARVSELTQRIILDEREDSSERGGFVREAALKPAIHRELWEEFQREGSVPSDANLAHKLRFQRNFTDRAIREFIPQFRGTLTFAKLIDADGTLDSGADKLHREGEANVNSATMSPQHTGGSNTPPPGLSALQIPLAPGEYATLQAAFPLTEAKWKQLEAVLSVFKSGLIAPDEDSWDSAEVGEG